MTARMGTLTRAAMSRTLARMRSRSTRTVTCGFVCTSAIQSGFDAYVQCGSRILIRGAVSIKLRDPISLQAKERQMPDYSPDPKMKFTFGLWTVGNVGRDPFGEPTRRKLSLEEICQLLGEVGAYGVNFHDNDAIPIDATDQQAREILKTFKKSLKDNGLVCAMAT